ncbi:MAG TPA: tetratricopeptide repeat protein [Planctomycetota bacterium]|nr:tetratricopeptide repeat protein [Planctomycetota bacterium]
MSKLYEKAAEAVKKRNYDYAIELFIQELTLEPNNVEARKALRAAELRKFQELGLNPEGGASAAVKGLGSMFAKVAHSVSKNHEKVMLDCEQLLKNGPRNKAALASLGAAARAAGHLEAAVCAYEDLCDADRENTTALRGLAQIWKEKGDISRALAYYEKLKRVLPSDAEAAKAVRDLAASGATKRVEDAKAQGDGSFRDMIKDKGEAEKLEQAQHRVRTEGEAEARIKHLESEIEKKPEEAARLLKQIGDLHLKRKDPEAALEAYQRAFDRKKDPQIADAIGDLKMKLLEDDAAKLAEAAKAGDAQAKAKERGAKEKLREYQIQEFSRRVQDRPTEVALKFQLGQVLYNAGKYDEAIQELQKAASDPRRGVQARLLLGKSFEKKGMLDLAIKELEKARAGSTAMDDSTKEITYRLATILEKAGQKSKAAAEYEKIIEVDIGYKDAMKRMEALKGATA